MKTSAILIPWGSVRWLPLLCWLVAVSTSSALQQYGDFSYEINNPDTNYERQPCDRRQQDQGGLTTSEVAYESALDIVLWRMSPPMGI